MMLSQGDLSLQVEEQGCTGGNLALPVGRRRVDSNLSLGINAKNM